MPTIARLNNVRIVIYPNDHRPAHVHAIGGGCEAVFVLNCPTGPTHLRESYGFDDKALRMIAVELDAKVRMLCNQWSTMHGDY